MNITEILIFTSKAVPRQKRKLSHVLFSFSYQLLAPDHLVTRFRQLCLNEACTCIQVPIKTLNFKEIAQFSHFLIWIPDQVCQVKLVNLNVKVGVALHVLNSFIAAHYGIYLDVQQFRVVN